MIDRIPDPLSDAMNYDHWPRSIRIAWCCTLPLGLGLMMLGTALGLPMIWMALTRRVVQQRSES